MTPECDRDPGFDPDEQVVWDADKDAPMWTDGADDNGIGGFAPVERNERLRFKSKR